MPSFRDGVDGDNVEDVAWPFSVNAIRDERHNHVPHLSSTAAYSGVPSSPSPLVRGATNGISDIEVGMWADRCSATLILENKGGV